MFCQMFTSLAVFVNTFFVHPEHALGVFNPSHFSSCVYFFVVNWCAICSKHSVPQGEILSEVLVEMFGAVGVMNSMVIREHHDALDNRQRWNF